jgi:hypothetical protein
MTSTVKEIWTDEFQVKMWFVSTPVLYILIYYFTYLIVYEINSKIKGGFMMPYLSNKGRRGGNVKGREGGVSGRGWGGFSTNMKYIWQLAIKGKGEGPIINW